MMATAVSASKPAPYHAGGGKVKRSPQQQMPYGNGSGSGSGSGSVNMTAQNGVKATQPSPTLAAANRPKQPSLNSYAAVNGINGRTVAKRKESQKNEEVDVLRRGSKTSSAEDIVNGERRKISPEPYVKSTSYILKKYKGSPPSFTIHLHPTHFRFDQQDGSFSYNSEMKFIIEHIKAGTVPHDMVEELLKGGVPFYEGCLIVRIVDHKTVPTRPDTNKSPSGEKIVPFSLHNYNPHITPSPYAPFPKIQDKEKAKSGTNGTSTDKPEAQPSDEPETAKDTTVNGDASKPRVFTTVLHPTPLSLQAEITLCALTPDPRAPKRQQPSQANGRGSTTQQSDRGHPAKRQKMMVEPDELPEFESKLILATAPSLYLDPVDSPAACQKLLQHLQSPRHCNKPPSPKIRRRTVAELAADEALAAEEERFMLLMDERLEPAASGTNGAPKSAVVNDEGGAAPFEPRFSRFKTLENIRAQHEEKAKREHDRKLQQDQAKRQQQDAEREKRRILEAKQAGEANREEIRKQYLANQAAQAQAQAQAQTRAHAEAQAHAQAQAQAQAQAAQAQMAARRPPSQGNAAGFPQHMVSTQGPQSSPIVRNVTPHASSPLAGNMMGTQPGQMPTAMGMASQGAGSPLQVSAGLQHGHPGVMAHPMMASRSQQGQSRHGTPQMAHGTPSMAHSTPIMSHATPNQRMSHASPSGSAVAPTPVMNNHALPMGATQMNGNGMLTPQQQQAYLARQMQLAQQHGLGGGGGGGGHQYNPQQLAHLHAQQNVQQHQQQHPGMQFANQQQNYQAQLLRNQLAQMQMSQGQQVLGGQQVNGMGQPQRAKGPATPYHALYQQQVALLRSEWVQRHLAEYGSPQAYPPNIRKEFIERTDQKAREIVSEVMRKDRLTNHPRAVQFAQIQLQSQRQQALQQQHQQQQQQQQQMMNGMGK